MGLSTLFVTATALIFGVAASVGAAQLPTGDAGKRVVAQQCLDDLQKFDEELARVGFGALQYPTGGYEEPAPSGYAVWGMAETPRQKIRSLREAAYVYALDGDEQSCQKILASMRQVYAEHQSLVGSETDDPNARMAWRRAHLARAKPVAEMNHLVRADSLIGAEVRNLKDEGLGEIEDLVLNPEKQQVLYVLISRGGFLGIGGKLVAVRWPDLRATEDHELYVLDVSPKAFEAGPTVERQNFSKTADPNWQRSVDQYWNQFLK